jgi:hypothetical protein
MGRTISRTVWFKVMSFLRGRFKPLNSRFYMRRKKNKKAGVRTNAQPALGAASRLTQVCGNKLGHFEH